jgi:hypothetical protein
MDIEMDGCIQKRNGWMDGWMDGLGKTGETVHS